MNSRNRPAALAGNYVPHGSYRLVTSTGAVTTIAARTASAGQLLVLRNPSTTTKLFIRYVGAKFILTTAYGTAQETGCDMILARSFSVNATNGTAVDVGDTVTDTGKLSQVDCGTSVITAGCVRVATSAAITAGTHTLDANPIGIVSDWSGAIGDMVPRTTSAAKSGLAPLFDARHEAASPIVLAHNEGFVIRNLILMGATGVGRWDFCVEWDEGIPQ